MIGHRSWSFPSVSNPSKPHIVRLQGTQFLCDCWPFLRTRTCAHVEEAKKDCTWLSLAVSDRAFNKVWYAVKLEGRSLFMRPLYARSLEGGANAYDLMDMQQPVWRCYSAEWLKGRGIVAQVDDTGNMIRSLEANAFWWAMLGKWPVNALPWWVAENLIPLRGWETQ